MQYNLCFCGVLSVISQESRRAKWRFFNLPGGFGEISSGNTVWPSRAFKAFTIAKRKPSDRELPTVPGGS